MTTNADSLGLDHMRAFIALVEKGSQVRAAESLGIAQATVWRHVTRVEDHFGGRLFEAGTSGPLSTRGLLVEQTLRSVLARLEHDRDRLAMERPVLRIGFIRAMRPLIERALREPTKKRNELPFDVRLIELQSEQQARKLQSRELDVAVCYAIDDLFDDRTGIEALVVPEHACVRGQLVLRALAELNYVHLSRRFARDTLTASAQWLATHGLAPQCRIECKLGTEILAYAAAGRGYGFLPALWRTTSHEGAVFMPLPDFAQVVGIAAYSLQHLSPWVIPFRESLLRVARAALHGFPELSPR
jgi:DNA-binding transcriptional LysR family regulator